MIFILSFFTFVASAKTTEIKSVQFPRVVSYRGNVEVKTGKETQFRKAKHNEILREFAEIKTGPQSQAEIAIDEVRTLTVLADTEIEIPSIGWETGDMGSMILKDGEIFWQKTKKVDIPAVLKSKLFEVVPPVGQFKLSYDSDKAYAEAKVFSGSLEFSAMNSEHSVLLTPGKKVGFQGVMEDGEVAYDVLMQGRKIPKGALGKVQDISKEEMQAYSTEELTKKKAADLKRIAAERNKKQALLPGQICRSPGGKLNECSWVCKNNPAGAKGKCLTSKPGVSCFRHRCNANGEWGEETALDAGEGAVKCSSTPHVASCDY
jgi:hypothetical protein